MSSLVSAFLLVGAALLKSLLFLFGYWLLQSGVLLFYMHWMLQAGDERTGIDAERRGFLRRLRFQQVSAPEELALVSPIRVDSPAAERGTDEPFTRPGPAPASAGEYELGD